MSRRRPAREARRAGRQSARADRRRVILAHVKAGYSVADAQRAAAHHSHVTRALQAVHSRVRREHQIRVLLHTLARLEAAARARGAQ